MSQRPLGGGRSYYFHFTHRTFFLSGKHYLALVWGFFAIFFLRCWLWSWLEVGDLVDRSVFLMVLKTYSGARLVNFAYLFISTWPGEPSPLSRNAAYQPCGDQEGPNFHESRRAIPTCQGHFLPANVRIWIPSQSPHDWQVVSLPSRDSCPGHMKIRSWLHLHVPGTQQSWLLGISCY